MDTLGCALAGSKLPECQAVAKLILDWGGKEESTIVASSGVKVPAPNAAFVNGTMPRAVDYEDTHDTSGSHIGSPVVPAAFAIAEQKGKGLENLNDVREIIESLP